MPLSIKLHGAALKGVTIAKGLEAGKEGVPVSYTALTTLLFESVNSFVEAFIRCRITPGRYKELYRH